MDRRRMALTWFLTALAGLGSVASAPESAQAEPAPADSPLLLAARSGDPESVNALMEAGAPPDEANAEGHTPLMAAAARGHAAVVRVLLERGADPARLAGDGYSALDHAMERGQRQAVVELLRHWALAAAPDAGSREAARALAAGEVRQGPFPGEAGSLLLSLLATQGRDGEAIELLTKGVDPDALDRSGYRPLAMAARWGRLELVRALLARGARPDAATRSRYQSTALMEASRDGHVLVAQALLEAGADVNRGDRHGDHALNWTCYFGHAELAELLVERGARLDVTGQTDDTPIEIARREKHPAVVAVLERAGARPGRPAAPAGLPELR